MRWCENHSVDYVLGIGRNNVLEQRISPLMEQAEAAFEQTAQKQRLFGETEYAAQTWDRPRRVIMVEPVGERAEQCRTPPRRSPRAVRGDESGCAAPVGLRRGVHAAR